MKSHKIAERIKCIMFSFHKIFIFTFLLLFLVSGISAQNVEEKRVENWISDIDFYATKSAEAT